MAGSLREIPLPVIMSVTGPESYLATARLGLGLVQVPRFHVEDDLARGTMVQVLGSYPPPTVSGVAALTRATGSSHRACASSSTGWCWRSQGRPR